MSKLRDRIRRTFQRRPGPLGFAPRSRQADEHRYVIVIAEVADAAAATAAADAGADALLHAGGRDGIEAVVEAAGDLPVGARLEAATGGDADALIEAGADFLVFDDAQTEAAALLRDELGHVALLGDADASEEELRLLQPLDLDALLVPPSAGALSVRDQLRTRRIAELTRKPLIVAVAASVSTEELRIWRDAGAPAALATGDAGDLEGVIAAAREVPAPRERREERPDPLLPSSAAPADDFDDD